MRRSATARGPTSAAISFWKRTATCTTCGSRPKYTDGVQPLGSAEIGAAPLIELRWSPRIALRLGVPIEVPGVVCTFVIDSREGHLAFRSPVRQPAAA